MENSSTSKYENSFKGIELIFLVLLITQVTIGVLFYFLSDSGIVEPLITEFQFLPIVVLLINSPVILLVKFLFTKRSRIDHQLSLEQKVAEYKKYTFLIMFLIDFANIINLVIYLLSGDLIYILVAVLVLFLYLIYKPSKEKFAQISLTREEKSEFLSEQSL